MSRSVANEHPAMPASRATVQSNFRRHGRFTWHQRRRHALVRKLVTGLQGQRLLDYGCGYGDLTFALSKTNPVVGIDTDPERIAFARQQYPELVFREFPGGAAPFPDASFDAVLSCVVLPFVSDHGAYLHDARRLLIDGGRLILLTKNLPVVQNTLRHIARRPPVVPRLNVVPASNIRERICRAGFVIESEGFFYDPPNVDLRAPKSVLVNSIEQLLSVVGVACTANYVSFCASAC